MSNRTRANTLKVIAAIIAALAAGSVAFTQSGSTTPPAIFPAQ